MMDVVCSSSTRFFGVTNGAFLNHHERQKGQPAAKAHSSCLWQPLRDADPGVPATATGATNDTFLCAVAAASYFRVGDSVTERTCMGAVSMDGLSLGVFSSTFDPSPSIGDLRVSLGVLDRPVSIHLSTCLFAYLSVCHLSPVPCFVRCRALVVVMRLVPLPVLANVTASQHSGPHALRLPVIDKPLFTPRRRSLCVPRLPDLNPCGGVCCACHGGRALDEYTPAGGCFRSATSGIGTTCCASTCPVHRHFSLTFL